MEHSNGGAKTRQQMADEYGICRKTFNKLLLRRNIRIDRGLILPLDQKRIYDKLGDPSTNNLYSKVPKNSH